MSKKCAKCEKTVYTTEELKCLDKIWHKACFRCWECNMALNMKNYKGYDKKPYCNAHYPVTKYTAVAETPEMARIASNTKMQSQIRYHEDFEKNIKGSKIQVADDPETLRIKASTAHISQVEYKGMREKANEMEERRGNIAQNTDAGPISRPTGKVSDYDPTRVGGVKMTPSQPEEYNASPASSKNVGHSTIYSQQGKVEQSGTKRVGSISDYDPLNSQFGSLTSGYAPGSTLRQRQEWEESYPEPQPQNHAPQAEKTYNPPPGAEHYPAPQHAAPPPQPMAPPAHHQMAPPSHHMPPSNHQMAPAMPQRAPPSHQMAPPPEPQAPIQPPPPQPEPVAPPPAPASTNNLAGPVYQAMYDYEAQDDDEIGFIENDLIIECQPIDEGWMFGTVRRTGIRGMLPANYVERVQ